MRTVERLEELRKGRRVASLKIFIGLLLVFTLVLAVYMLINSNLFTVGTIVVSGNKYVQVEDIYNIADIPERVNIFKLSTAQIAKRLSSDLRIAGVNVHRQFPAAIVIEVKERQPLAYAVTQFGFVQLDKQGVIMAAFKNIHAHNIPLITGVILGNCYVGDRTDTPELNNALSFLSFLDEKIISQLSEISIKDSSQIIIYTNNSIQIRVGNNERFSEKARWLQEIIEEITVRKMLVEYVDLNFNEPIIKFKQ